MALYTAWYLGPFCNYGIMRHYTDTELVNIVNDVICSECSTKRDCIQRMKDFLVEHETSVFDYEKPYVLFIKCCIIQRRTELSNDTMIKRSLNEWGRFHGKSYQFKDRNLISDAEYIILIKYLDHIGCGEIENYELRVVYLRRSSFIRVKYRGQCILVLRMITFNKKHISKTTFEVVFVNLTTDDDFKKVDTLLNNSSVNHDIRRLYMTHNRFFKSVAINFITFNTLHKIIKLFQRNKVNFLNVYIYNRLPE
jgi:hypothetical protein